MADDTIRLADGSGTGLAELLRSLVLPELDRDAGAVLEDAAVLRSVEGALAFTTDSFVVRPLEFPGGNIGKLAACGTINDLAMMGARPRWLALSLILEEGLSRSLLGRMLQSLSGVCRDCGVRVVCGDTKVVERGAADALFITTTGIGEIPAGRSLSATRARPGDAVLVSGPIGLHGVAVLACRKQLAFAADAVSDCAPLTGPVEALLAAVPDVRVLRDATRGGCAAVLNEIGVSSGVTFRIRESDVPVPGVVRSACAYLGMDPLQIANEGTFVATVAEADAERALQALRAHPLSRHACRIGQVELQGRFPVILETEIGGIRPVEVPPGEMLPRIC